MNNQQPERNPARGPESQPAPSPADAGDHDHEQAPPALHPRIWVGSLADYNAGRLHGEWLDAATDSDSLHAAVQTILASSREPDAEEWGIFDYDDFGVWKPGESEQLDVVARVARGLAEHGPAFAAWTELQDTDDEAMGRFSDAYLGDYESATAWADSVMDDLGWRQQLDGAVPEDLARYVSIDTEAWAQDAWLSGDIVVVHKPAGGVWIFDARA